MLVLGTGFSESEQEGIPKNMEEVADDFWDFLVEFFSIHDVYNNRKVYLAGQSFAGIYIPAISHKIV